MHNILTWNLHQFLMGFDDFFDPFLLTNKSWLAFIGKKQNKKFFEKKIKMADSKKKQCFSKLPILNNFCENFMDWSVD